MTMEAYIEKILAENPEFVAKMNDRVANEYAEQIARTRGEYAERLEAAKNAWTANRGEGAFEENVDEISAAIKRKIGRYCFIKRIELSGDSFEAEIDLLEGSWSIAPV